jgi:hypothetical protein
MVRSGAKSAVLSPEDARGMRQPRWCCRTELILLYGLLSLTQCSASGDNARSVNS